MLKNSPGIVAKLQSPSEEQTPSNLASAFAQAKIILPEIKKESSLTTTKQLSNSMTELSSSQVIFLVFFLNDYFDFILFLPTRLQFDDSKKQSTDKGKRRSSIKQLITGATHRKKYSAVCKQLKESLSRESSLEKTDQLTTGAHQFKNTLGKITTSSSLLPQFSLKDEQLDNKSQMTKQSQKRRMSVFTDWKPSFHIKSAPEVDTEISRTSKTNVVESKTSKESRKSNQHEQIESIEQLEKHSQLNKLDEEIEEEDGLTELSSPQLSKRSSAVAIHEMKQLSPGTSLSGVFYCSSSVQSIHSNRKSSLSIQNSSRTSINSTGESATSGITNNQTSTQKLQRRSTLNVSSCRRRNRLNKEELSDKGKEIQTELDLEPKRRSVSSDLTLDTAFHSTFLNHQQFIYEQKQCDQQPTNTQSTTSNYANQQPLASTILTQTIVEEIANQQPQHTVPNQNTAIIDFNQLDLNQENSDQPNPNEQLATTNNLNLNINSRHSSCTSTSSKRRSLNSKSGGVDQVDKPESSLKTSSLDNGVQIPRKFCVYFRWYDWMTKRNDCSLFIFPPSNRFRQRCVRITEHETFDYVVLIFISLNCITLACERPRIPPWSAERELLNAANYVFTLVFAVEMLLKVVAKGLWYSSDAYFKSGFNIMDGILVFVSLFDLTLSMIAQRSPRILGILRVFRLLRSLRPLR